MKIIDQTYEILNLPDNLLGMIEAAGRTCYKSEDKIGCTGKGLFTCPYRPGQLIETPLDGCPRLDCEKHSAQKFAKMLLDRGHHAMLEFGDITVRFVTNRGVTHELVRHRLFSFAQESTRYVRYDGEMEFIRPVWCSEKIIGDWGKGGFPELEIEQTNYDFMHCCVGSEFDYQTLLGKGWRPEQAREVLPNSLKTEIVVKGNIREWRHCLTLRTSKKAHPQIRALMLPLLDELREKIPVVFDDIE